jgi:hypothetical protein
MSEFELEGQWETIEARDIRVGDLISRSVFGGRFLTARILSIKYQSKDAGVYRIDYGTNIGDWLYADPQELVRRRIG